MPPGQQRVKIIASVAWRAPDNQPSAGSPQSSAPSRCSTSSPRIGSSARTRSHAVPESTPAPCHGSSPRSTAAGLVEHVPDTGRYRLGLRLLELGNVVLARLDLRELARPHLQALVEETGETATLSAPGERDAITVDFVQSPSVVQSVARLGRPSIGHATATGKVLLAFGGAAIPRGRLTAYTDRTIVDRKALEAELDRVRAQGWARATGEREDDLSAVAAPVRDGRGGLVGIMGVQGPSARFDERAMAEAVEPLLERAAAVSAALGYAAGGVERR